MGFFEISDLPHVPSFRNHLRIAVVTGAQKVLNEGHDEKKMSAEHYYKRSQLATSTMSNPEALANSNFMWPVIMHPSIGTALKEGSNITDTMLTNAVIDVWDQVAGVTQAEKVVPETK